MPAAKVLSGSAHLSLLELVRELSNWHLACRAFEEGPKISPCSLCVLKNQNELLHQPARDCTQSAL